MTKDPAFFIGEPVSFYNKCFIYPPKIKEVVTTPDFNTYLKILTTGADELSELFKKNIEEDKSVPTPLEFLLSNCYNSREALEKTKEAFKFFIRQDVSFFYEEKMIIFGDINDLITKIKDINEVGFLNEENFFEFQNLIRDASGETIIKPLEPDDPNEDPRIKAMKAKARYRDMVKAKNLKKAGSKNGTSFMTTLAAICCMGLGITPLTIGEMSYAAMSIINVYQAKEEYETSIRSLLAGADSKKIHPKYWIRNLSD